MYDMSILSAFYTTGIDDTSLVCAKVTGCDAFFFPSGRHAYARRVSNFKIFESRDVDADEMLFQEHRAVVLTEMIPRVHCR